MTRKLTERELSVSQLSRETGLSRSAIFWRAVKYGENSPLVGHAARLNSTPAKDHTGRVFPSLRKMAEHWGVPYAVFYSRFKKGWPLEAAADVPLREILETFGSKK